MSEKQQVQMEEDDVLNIVKVNVKSTECRRKSRGWVKVKD